MVDTGGDYRPEGQRCFRVANRPIQQRATQWPTVFVILGVYGGFAMVSLFHRSIPWYLNVVGLALISAWHGSLQHELLHGNGVRNERLANALATFTMNLWLPFADYRSTHLQHHRDDFLTDPYDDPESTYRSGSEWAALSLAMRVVLWINRTLIGRFVIGPAIVICRYAKSQWAALLHDAGRTRRIWLGHIIPVCITGVWILGVTRMPVWEFVLGAVYGGTSFTLVRSFAEHTWAPTVQGRTAIVKSRGFFALLFLNNNLHVTHHARPNVAWFKLPAMTRQLGCESVASEGAGLFRNYGSLFVRYAVRPKCQPANPADVGARPRPQFKRLGVRA